MWEVVITLKRTSIALHTLLGVLLQEEEAAHTLNL